MKSRVIKRAKRRGVTAVDDEAAANKPAVFTGFAGMLCIIPISIGNVINIPIMQLFTGISRNIWPKSYH